MWPVILELGPIKLYSFGLMAAMAMLGGGRLLKIELDRRGYPDEMWNNYALGALIGGFAGAKLNFLILHLEILQEDFFRSLFSGAGLVWYGGFLGGALTCFIMSRHYRHSFADLSDAFSPALALAYLLGRVGCFLSGDGDYGFPTDVPWGMAFPNGVVPTTVPVHPTPLYEIAIMGVFLGVLWKTRHRNWAPWGQFGLYLILAGTERFTIEFWRTNTPGLFGLTTAQQISVAIFVLGLVLWLTRHSRKPKEEVAA